MSFKCDSCHVAQRAGTKPNRVVMETRMKRYPKRFALDEKTVIDNGGYGEEIVKEANLCNTCVKEING